MTIVTAVVDSGSHPALRSGIRAAVESTPSVASRVGQPRSANDFAALLRNEAGADSFALLTGWRELLRRRIQLSPSELLYLQVRANDFAVRTECITRVVDSVTGVMKRLQSS